MSRAVLFLSVFAIFLDVLHAGQDNTSGSMNADPNDGIQNNCDLNKDFTKDIFSLLIKNLETESNETQSSEKELNTDGELEISVVSNASTKPPFVVEGRRIVDFDYFFNQMKTLCEHNPGFGCTISNLQVIKEKRFGLDSMFCFQCNMCNQQFKINSCEKLSENVTVSHAAVTGAMLIGCGRTNLNELLTAMDLPKLEQRIYNECHKDVSNWWAVAAESSMKEAAKDEAQLAIESGHTINGIPAITVVADACWSKRSYRTNYAAASGASAIIGFKTGKVLHMEVKNKYCIVCARSVAKSRPPPTHECTKNHVGSSTSMEQISIVEGFKSSVHTHNLIYDTLIADGDASTYKKILESRPYPNVQVQKIECSNHLLRNYCTKLMQLQKDTSIPLSERKLLTSDKITRFRTAIRSAARFRKAQETSSSDKIIKLRDDIINSPKHILGDHSACENYYCTDERKKEQNLVPLAKTLFKKIMVCTTQIALNSKSLLYDVNNNRAEQFNSIVAKHIGGKRINFSLKNSYTARCHAAVVAFNTGKAQYSLYKTNFLRSPRKSIKRLELKRCQNNSKRKLRPAGLKKRTIFHDKNDYGERCQKPDLTAEQYETARNVFLESLKGLVEKRHKVERDTILQAESALWLELRRSLLTASSFSKATTGAEPQVAVLCEAGGTYHPQYMSAAGRWTPDLTTKPHNCLKDKMEILDYCKKVYPSHDITNIVEASHYVKVSNWCKLGTGSASKCKVTRWVKPFRCLEGPFQSDALLVPESCLFDHIHNQSRCWQFARWNATAGRACAQRGLRLRTFAMLLPCGISLFSGVEFVCCPKHFKENVKMHKPMDVGVPVSPGGEEMLAASAAMDERDDDLFDDDDALDDDDDDDTLNLSDDDDDDDADDEMDEDEDAELSRDDDAEDDDYTDNDDSAWPRPESSASPTPPTTSTTTTTTTTASTATSDPYFSHFDPRTEHQSYKDAQQRLEETHREKITKVMKEWSELEDRYQQMMSSDPAAAQTFRQRMTAKFQANVQSLEEEGVAERRRLAALHQQRVLAHLAQRRRTALSCYTRSLRDTPPNAHRVQKCLQRLVRALAAERSGALAAWRRAAAAGREAAAAERASAADRLQDADRALQRALAALRRRPHLYSSIGTAIEDYVQSMQSKDDMAVSLMAMTPEAEELLLDRIEAEVQREQAARDQLNAKRDQRTRKRQDIQNERAKTSNGVHEIEESDDEIREAEIETDDTTPVPRTAPPAPAPSAPASPPAELVEPEPKDITTRAAYTQETTTTEVITSTITEAPESETPDTNEPSETSSRRSTSETEGSGLRAALEQAEERAPPPPAHALKHELQHSQPGYTIRGTGANSPGSGAGAGALYPALCVGGAALAAAACVALAVARRRDRAPQAQGFVQVEQTGAVAPTPEERHVANMQINGYENPTYKYFEVKE